MMAIPRALIATVALLITACAHSARPVRFIGSLSAASATDVIARTVLGDKPLPEADRERGIIATPWADTGDRYPEPDLESARPADRQTVIVRRYRIEVGSQGGATAVQIDMEVKRCEPGFQVVDDSILGSCGDVAQIYPKLKRDLDDFGERIRSLIARRPDPSDRSRG
jgi:hypothetical protein